jgi:hypothetical protein
MTFESTPRPGRADDDEPAVPEPHDELPDHLDRSIEVPEADALEQELEVPIDDEDD